MSTFGFGKQKFCKCFGILAVLEERKLSVAVIDTSLNFVRVVTAVAAIVAKNDHRAFFCKYGNAVQRSYCRDYTSALSYTVDIACKEVCPHAIGEPYLGFGKTVFLALLGNGGNQQALTEEVFIFIFVAFGRVGILIIQRLAKGQSLLVCQIIAGVKERDHAMPQHQRFFSQLANSVFVSPRLLGKDRGVGAVHTVDWIEYAKLQKAQIKLVVLHAEMMTADIVAPPRVADITCRCGEVWHQAKCFPRDRGIPRKADGVAVRADPRVTGYDQRMCVILSVIKIVVVVECPEGVQTVHCRFCALLPVDPPKINAVALIGVMKHTEIFRYEFFIRDIKFNHFFGGRIYPHCLCHFMIHILVIADA